MAYIGMAEVKKQLVRISEALDEPVVIIGGLAVNQYVPTRDSLDIDLVCDYETSRSFLISLYPSTEWKHKDENANEYRPAHSISHKHKVDYPKILIGPKITERGAYKYLDWDQLKDGAIPFRVGDANLTKILVPSIESLCFSKFVSLMARDLSNKNKLLQDLSDIRELSNDDSFRLGAFLNLVVASSFDRELGVPLVTRLETIGGTFENSNIGKLISLISPNLAAKEMLVRSQVPSPLQPRPRKTPSTGKVRLAAFDLDGTIIKGIRHSWTMVWNQLKQPGDNSLEEGQKERKEKFRNGDISYLEWCRLDGQACREYGLNRGHFEKIKNVGHISVTKKLRDGIMLLRENNVKTAIISGGVDALLYAMIPDADDLFDDILINRFVFDEEDEFDHISATEYDWDDSKVGVVGKRRGLERLCEKYEIAIEDSAFSGDDFNDIEAMRAAGLKILYCGDTREFTTNADSYLPRDIAFMPENNFMKVAERILSGVAAERL